MSRNASAFGTPGALACALLISLSSGCPAPSTSKSDTTTPAKRPHGSQAYPGVSAPQTEGLGQAPDASLRDEAGKEIQLSSLWSEEGVYLIFYRGDW